MSTTTATPGPALRPALMLMLLFTLILFAGCAQMERFGLNTSNTSAPDEESHPEPYNPADFNDLLIPSELTWSREKSMVVNTESFAGGVLYFSGRVEVNSLTDFFLTTMPRKNWKLVGSVKYRDVLLAFTKPNKTCTITIKQSEFGQSANINIYITEEISGGKHESVEAPAKTTPFSF